MLPQLGAARAYFGDDEWQAAVADWIARARLIVVIAGTTPWVQWELREIARAGQVGRLLVLVPPGAPADRRQRVEYVADALGDSGPGAQGVDSSRIVALRFHDGPGADARRSRVIVVESATAGEVDYELAIRVVAGCGRIHSRCSISSPTSSHIRCPRA